jgi:hypothetical protein
MLAQSITQGLIDFTRPVASRMKTGACLVVKDSNHLNSFWKYIKPLQKSAAEDLSRSKETIWPAHRMRVIRYPSQILAST